VDLLNDSACAAIEGLNIGGFRRLCTGRPSFDFIAKAVDLCDAALQVATVHVADGLRGRPGILKEPNRFGESVNDDGPGLFARETPGFFEDGSDPGQISGREHGFNSGLRIQRGVPCSLGGCLCAGNLPERCCESEQR
jgi:hypothetical protein